MEETARGTGEKRQKVMEDLEVLIDVYMEERLSETLRSWVTQQGVVLQGDNLWIALGSEWRVNGAVQVRFPDGLEGWVLVSSKPKAWPWTIQEFMREILQDPQTRARLRAKGVGDPVWPVLFALAAEYRALEAAQQAKVGLMLSHQGMAVAPRLWSLEQGAPLEE